MYAFAYPGAYPGLFGGVLTPSAYDYPGFGYGASKDSKDSKSKESKEPAESSKVKVKTEKGAKNKGEKGEKGDKAKAKVSKDKLKSKAEKKPKAEKAEKVPKVQGPRDTLDWPKGVAVSGCKDKTVKKIVRGDFKFAGENHARPYYKRDEKYNDLDVMLYYWDDRDGSDFSGWWFGPKVGGDQVWAYHPGRDTTPPESGWKVPYDGPVDDSFKLTRKKEKKEKKDKESEAMPYPGMYYGMQGMQPAFMDPHAAERQMQEYARLQQEQAKRRLEEEFHRQKREEALRREAERKRKEEARKKQEEIRKKREEEQKKQKELAEQRIKEGKAVFLLRKAIQKLTAATPESMEIVQKELEETMKLHLEEAGSQKDYMKGEADKYLEQTKKRIELLNEAKRKAQEKKEADEKRRQELEARAKELLAELSGLLDMAEKGVEQLKETATPLETSDEQTLPEVEACSEAVEAAGSSCKTLIKTCMDFLVSHGPEMKEPPSVGVAVSGPSELKQLMARCLTRINECTKLSDGVLFAVRAVKDAAARRVEATKKTMELEELFSKYDVDRDQLLSEKEVQSFAKDLGVEISPEVMKQIWKSTVEHGQEGVSFTRFPLLKSKLGAEKELRRDRYRKVLREARDKVRANLRAQLDTKVGLMGHEIRKAEEAVRKVEHSLPPLAEQERSAMTDAELTSKSSSCRSMVEDARLVASSVQKKIDELPNGFAEKDQEDVKDLLVPDFRVLAKQMGRLDLRLQRVENLCHRFKSEVEKREKSQLFGARLFAVKVARLYAARRGRSIRQLFREMDANGDGTMDSQEFSLFFLSVDREILEEASAKEQLVGDAAESPAAATAKAKARPRSVVTAVDFTEDLLSRLFKSVAESGMMSEDIFCQMMRSYCKVVKDTVMTKELKVSGDNAVRQLKTDEVVEVLEGPMEEEEMKVPRIKARCLADDAQGWLTVRGNDGIAHLQDWHALFRIIRDVPLTANFERPADKVLEGPDDSTAAAAVAPKAEAAEATETLEADAADAVAVEGVEVTDGDGGDGDGGTEGDGADGDGDDLFDPESPEGPGDFEPQSEMAHYQLLQHVDSPEHEDPDEGFRRLRAGELVEVLEWPASHMESGLTRMKVVALSDKANGWITQTNADGVHFAEPHEG